MGTAASGLKKVTQERGPGSVAFIGSTRCSNEDNYILMKLARDVVKTGNIDTRSRLSYFPVLDAFQESMGFGTSTVTIDRIADADFILVVGADLKCSSPQVASRVFEALQRNATLAVVDPRSTGLAKLARHHMKILPGSDLYWIDGMISHLIREKKVDAEFLNNRSVGYEHLKNELQDFPPSVSEEKTSVPVELLETVAECLAGARRACIIIGSGISNASDIKRTARGLINLALLTGHAGYAGKDGSGILLTGGDNNTQGAWDMGAVPDRLPGGISISGIKESAPRRIGSGTAPVVGKTYPEILEGVLRGEIRALYVMGENPLAFAEGKGELKRALAKLELLVVQELFPTELTELAGVLFPAAALFERGGTVTNLEGRVQRFDPVLEPLENTKPDWEIAAAVATSMGTGLKYEDVFNITDEISSLVPLYKSINSVVLARETGGVVQAEVRGGREVGSPEGEERKWRFHPALPAKEDLVETSEEYPLLVIPGRLPSFWYSGARSSRIRFLAREENRSCIHVNPKDAGKIGVKRGWRVRVTCALGSLETSVEIEEDLPQGVAYLPLHDVDGMIPRFSRRSVAARIETL